MTIKAHLRRKQSTGWILALLAFVALNLLYFVGEVNSDWAAYEYLYESGGGWLSDRGRDVGFLRLVEVVKVFGTYELFRFLIAAYFFAFAVWLFKRWRYYHTNKTYLWAFAGLLPLLIPKFTVQIREGLADTLMLVAFTLLFERERRYGGVKALWPTVLILTFAANIHSGTIIFLAALLIPYCVYSLTKFFDTRNVVRNAVVLTVAAICIFLYVADFDTFLRVAAEEVLGTLTEKEVETGVFKQIYWAAKFLSVGYLAWQIKGAQYRQPAFSMFMRYTAYAVIPALQIAVLYLIFAGYPEFIASVAIRAYHTVFYAVFALASLTTRATPLNAAVAAALLLDEYRVMTVQIS